MDFEIIAGGSAMLAIVAIIEVLKMLGLSKKYAPIAAVTLGLVFSLSLAFYGEAVHYSAAVRGIIAGLSAVGLYSGAKNTAEAFREE